MKIVIKPIGAVMLLLVLGWSFFTIVRLSQTKAATAEKQNSKVVSTSQMSFALENGTFSDGDKLPDGWTNLPWMGEGVARLKRDTTEFHSSPASLSLEGTTTRTYTALDHFIGARPTSGTFTVRGWIKTEGDFQEASVGIRGREIIGEIAPQKEWVHVLDARTTSEWTPFEKRVSLQPGSNYAYLVIVLRGKGKVWVDDLSISP